MPSPTIRTPHTVYHGSVGTTKLFRVLGKDGRLRDSYFSEGSCTNSDDLLASMLIPLALLSNFLAAVHASACKAAFEEENAGEVLALIRIAVCRLLRLSAHRIRA